MIAIPKGKKLPLLDDDKPEPIRSLGPAKVYINGQLIGECTEVEITIPNRHPVDKRKGLTK